jgi:phosphoenolpyruvate carboxykinase (GTP)
MAILEVESPDGELTYIAAAFPSGCGKTSLAMMDVCPTFAERGYKVRCVGDDVAWLRKGSDGRLWATNPESGIFGLAPGLNAESNPNVFAATQKNAIFTNVVHNTDDNTVWWEGMPVDPEFKEKLTPDSLINWRGESWTPPDEPVEVVVGVMLDEDEEDEYDEFGEKIEKEEDDEPKIKEEKSNDPEPGSDAELEAEPTSAANKQSVRGAHSNSRFTVPLSNCPNFSASAYNSPEGVPISAIVFGSRRSKAIPLVYQAFDWEHGVFVGTIMGTETGGGSASNPAVRRDPMAMQTLCGYNMADYWGHWLKIGKKLGRKAPKIFNVNWFKNGEKGTPLWPGFGENIRVLDWIIKRTQPPKDGVKLGIVEAPMGYLPKAEDIDVTGLESLGITLESVEFLLRLEKTPWKEDVNAIKQFYAKFGDRLPERLREQLIDFEKRLLNS